MVILQSEDGQQACAENQILAGIRVPLQKQAGVPANLPVTGQRYILNPKPLKPSHMPTPTLGPLDATTHALHGLRARQMPPGVPGAAPRSSGNYT